MNVGDKVIIVGKSSSGFNDIPIGTVGCITSVNKKHSSYTVWDLNNDNWDFYHKESLQISKKYQRKDILDILLK